MPHRDEKGPQTAGHGRATRRTRRRRRRSTAGPARGGSSAWPMRRPVILDEQEAWYQRQKRKQTIADKWRANPPRGGDEAADERTRDPSDAVHAVHPAHLASALVGPPPRRDSGQPPHQPHVRGPTVEKAVDEQL